MKIVIKEAKSTKMNILLDWIFYIIGYALILITMTVIFKKTIYIDNQYFGFWAILASLIIYLLNKTIKPLLTWLTLPVTALTLGLFYPTVNVIILNIADFILGEHFKIQGYLMSFVVAIMISVMNILLNKLILERIIGE